MLKKKNRLIATKLKFSGIIVYVVKSMEKIVWQPISGDKTLPDVYKWIERVVKSTTATLNLILTCIKDRRLIWSMKWIGVGTLQFYYSVTIKKCINKLCYNASQSELSQSELSNSVSPSSVAESLSDFWWEAKQQLQFNQPVKIPAKYLK